MLWRHGSGGGLPSRFPGTTVHWSRYRASSGFDHFRHFAATLTLAGGVDQRAAARRLGHAWRR